MQAVLEDWRTAPIDARLRETLGFLEKLTLHPAQLSPADLQPLRAAGLSDRAIEEAIQVCYLFSLADRLADAFDFPSPGPKGRSRVGKYLWWLGYGLLGVGG